MENSPADFEDVHDVGEDDLNVLPSYDGSVRKEQERLTDLLAEAQAVRLMETV